MMRGNKAFLHVHSRTHLCCGLYQYADPSGLLLYCPGGIGLPGGNFDPDHFADTGKKVGVISRRSACNSACKTGAKIACQSAG
jgi:hypothetical protein